MPESEEKKMLEILNYRQIEKEFGNLKAKNSIYKTDMFGNTWYLYHEKKRLFLKPKRVNDIMLICCCGVHRQTFIDILIAYHFTREELEEK